jgi:hypothetical protein
VLILQLHSLITIEGDTELDVFVVGKSKPERVDSFAIRGKHDEMALVERQVINLDRLSVRPANGLPFVDPQG